MIIQGDSGGPFACSSMTEDRWTLIGIHSYVSSETTRKSKIWDVYIDTLDINVALLDHDLNIV